MSTQKALGSRAYHFPRAQLRPEAEKALEWLKIVCLHTSVDELAASEAVCAGLVVAALNNGDKHKKKRLMVHTESASSSSESLTPGGAASVASQAEALAKSLKSAGLKKAERLTNLLVTTSSI
jgi:hypothetical protein